jgi:hypothetical protein
MLFDVKPWFRKKKDVLCSYCGFKAFDENATPDPEK